MKRAFVADVDAPPCGRVRADRTRGDAHAVTFEPRKIPVTEGKALTTVRFSAPGTYLLRAYADDGMLVSAADVTVTVK